MLHNLTEDQRELAEFMSWISEEASSAGWINTLEYDLWAILMGGDRRYWRYTLTQEDIDRLKFLSDRCGCWIVFDDQIDEMAVTLTKWKGMFETYKNCH